MCWAVEDCLAAGRSHFVGLGGRARPHWFAKGLQLGSKLLHLLCNFTANAARLIQPGLEPLIGGCARIDLNRPRLWAIAPCPGLAKKAASDTRPPPSSKGPADSFSLVSNMVEITPSVRLRTDGDINSDHRSAGRDPQRGPNRGLSNSADTSAQVFSLIQLALIKPAIGATPRRARQVRNLSRPRASRLLTVPIGQPNDRAACS